MGNARCWDGDVNRGTRVGYGDVIDLDPTRGETGGVRCVSEWVDVRCYAGGRGEETPARCCLVGAK